MTWQIKSIGEVATLVNGGTPKSKIKEYWGGNVHWITPKDMGKLSNIYVQETSRKITKLGLDKSSAKLFPPFSVILSTRAPIGHLAINEVPMATNQGCRGIVPGALIEAKYLYYFLKSKIDLLNKLGSGTTFKELSTKNLAGVSIPIPPLPEQKQILAILDKAFAALDQAKANIEKNIQNAQELFQSKRESLFQNLKDCEVNLTEICEEIFAGGDAPKKDFSKISTKLLMIPIYANAVKNNGLYGYTNNPRVLEPSITIAARGSGTGHIELRDHPFVPIVRLIVLTPIKELILLQYLKFAISTLIIERSGSAIPQLTIPMIKKYNIPLPAIAIQQNVIDSLVLVENNLATYKSTLSKKLLSLTNLKKSLLQKAFSGELTKDFKS